MRTGLPLGLKPLGAVAIPKRSFPLDADFLKASIRRRQQRMYTCCSMAVPICSTAASAASTCRFSSASHELSQPETRLISRSESGVTVASSTTVPVSVRPLCRVVPSRSLSPWLWLLPVWPCSLASPGGMGGSRKAPPRTARCIDAPNASTRDERHEGLVTWPRLVPDPREHGRRRRVVLRRSSSTKALDKK